MVCSVGCLRSNCVCVYKMELDYGIVSCILFPGCSEENTGVEAADLFCTWVLSGSLPEWVSLGVSAQRKIKIRVSLRSRWIFAFILQNSLVSTSLVCYRMLSGKQNCSAIRMIVHSDLLSKTFGCTSVFLDSRRSCPPDLSVSSYAF